MGKERVMGRGKTRERVVMHEFTFPETWKRQWNQGNYSILLDSNRS